MPEAVWKITARIRGLEAEEKELQESHELAQVDLAKCTARLESAISTADLATNELDRCRYMLTESLAELNAAGGANV